MADRDVLDYQPPDEQRRERDERRRRSSPLIAGLGCLYYGVLAAACWWYFVTTVAGRVVSVTGVAFFLCLAAMFSAFAVLCGRELFYPRSPGGGGVSDRWRRP